MPHAPRYGESSPDSDVFTGERKNGCIKALIRLSVMQNSTHYCENQVINALKPVKSFHRNSRRLHWKPGWRRACWPAASPTPRMIRQTGTRCPCARCAWSKKVVLTGVYFDGAQHHAYERSRN